MRRNISPKMTEREAELHAEANRIARIAFTIFFDEMKKSSLKTMNAQEAMAMTADCIAMFSAQVIGTIYNNVKDNLSDFVTDNMIIETVGKAFRQNFDDFMKLQNEIKGKNQC